MGSMAYVYFVTYDPDEQRALDRLRVREFEEGRYYPVLFNVPSIIDERTDSGPKRQHGSVEEAMGAAGANGTRSILDIEMVADEAGFGVARRIGDKELEELFETAEPTRDQIMRDLPLQNVERGQAICLPVFDEAGKAVGLCFAGYSYD